MLADKIALSDVIGAGVGKTEKPKTAWGSYAATDVIRLSKQTEGPAFDGQLNILLSGGMSEPLVDFVLTRKADDLLFPRE